MRSSWPGCCWESWIGCAGRLAVGWLALAGALAVARPAWACGGCFSPPTDDPKQTVVQNAERVLFLRDDKTKQATVWIEVVYAGLAKDFGWVLPMPKVPQVATGPKLVFDALDGRLGFRVAMRAMAQENCRDPRQGCEIVNGETSATPAQDAGIAGGARRADVWTDPKVDGVEVLAHGYTGPYAYEVIKGTEADKLYTWLTLAGYAMPEKAKPILQIHATKGDVFLAVKLQNGQSVKAIKPIVLTMDDAEPCVPLRLTSIAAQEDMTVTVTLAGAGRAVVKNYFDVVLNPLRLLLLSNVKPTACLADAAPGAVCHIPDNYGQVLAAAIDEAAGHAFVTEASVAGASVGKLSPLQDLDLAPLKAVKTLLDLGDFLVLSALPLDDDVIAALQGPVGQTGLFMNATANDTFAALKSCAIYWKKPGATNTCSSGSVTLDKSKVQAAALSGEALAQGMQTSIIDPLFLVGGALKAAPRATRLVLRISPSEMDRDPVFAFAQNLPEVQPTRNVAFNQVCTQGWSNGELRTRLTLPEMGSWLVGSTSIIDPLFVKSPAAMVTLVQEEQGSPVPISVSDIAKVDAAIAGAVPGQPSIPKSLVLSPVTVWSPPPSAKPVTDIGAWTQPPNCVPKKGWENGKLPPTGQVVDPPKPDAGAPPDESGSDASGSHLPATTPAPASSSCATTPGGQAGGLLLMLCAVLLVWRRRTVA